MLKLLLVTALTIGVETFGFDMADAMKAYQSQDYKAAVTNWQFFAKRGDLSAQYNLAHMYLLGLGVQKGEKLSAQWMWFAAEGGLAAAQYDFGLMLLDGKGVEASEHRANFWLKKSAAQEYKKALLFFEKQMGPQQVVAVETRTPVDQPQEKRESTFQQPTFAQELTEPPPPQPVIGVAEQPEVLKPVSPIALESRSDSQKKSPGPIAPLSRTPVQKPPSGPPANMSVQYWVRFGTLRSNDQTREVLDRLSRTYRSVMGQTGFHLEVNDDSGEIRTRISVGPFFSEKEAVQFCYRVQEINSVQVCNY